MAKKQRPQGGSEETPRANGAKGGGQTDAGYFKALFAENPKLLKNRSNAAIVERWLADHPGQKEMPANVRANLSNVKSVLRSKGRKRRGRKRQEQDAQAIRAGRPPAQARPATRGLDRLEEQIDECMAMAKQLDRAALDEVIRTLRRARNAVVWMLGQ